MFSARFHVTKPLDIDISLICDKSVTTQNLHFLFIGVERNVCRRIIKRFSVIMQFIKLATGGQLCRRYTYRKV